MLEDTVTVVNTVRIVFSACNVLPLKVPDHTMPDNTNKAQLH